MPIFVKFSFGDGWSGAISWTCIVFIQISIITCWGEFIFDFIEKKKLSVSSPIP